MRAARALILAATLAGCAAVIPDEALRSADRSLTLALLREDPARHAGARVLLGGEILATRPRVGETEVEVLGRRLRAAGSPEWSDRSEGRFLARTERFLDPAVYAERRRITVLGTVVGAEERRIGDLPYRYPVVAAERIYLWPREPVWDPYPYRPWYDPWHYPWPYPGYPHGVWWHGAPPWP
jgi:outer membrane lipoprotein